MKTMIAAKYKQALELHRAGRLSDARKAYETILSVDPLCHEVLHLLGVLLAQQGDLTAAVASLQKAAELVPDNSTYHNNLGNALSRLDRLDEAVFHYEQALKLNPEYAEVYNNLGNIFYKKQDWQQALHYYVKAVTLQPEYANAHQNLGLVMLQQGKLPEAKKQFHNVITLNPHAVTSYFQLANIGLQENDNETAKKYYELTVQYQPQHLEALNNLAIVNLRQGESIEAIKYFKEVLMLNEAHKEARNNLAAAFLQLDRFVEAIEHYEYLYNNEGNSIEVNYNLGFAYMMIGELQKAIEQFQYVLEVNSHHADAYANLGACYLKLGDRDKATYYYQQALKLRPENPTVSFVLSALTGEQKTAPPKEYVRDLFDNYAQTFDKHLTQYLGYQAPQQLYHAVEKMGFPKEKNRILDLGCGTGLCAPLFSPIATELVGVDVSPKMLHMAEQKKLYTQLIEKDINQFLAEDSRLWDIIIAADVFVYIGELTPLFLNVAKKLNRRGGIFAFTAEISETSDLFLQKEGRYAYTKNYLDKLSKSVDFSIERYETIVVRLQEGKPLKSHLYILKLH